jgi:hypothetical protein
VNWLDKYDKDLTSLEKVWEGAFSRDLSTPAGFEAFSQDLHAILAPLKGKKIDSEAINLIASGWWNLSKARQMASLRKEIKIQLRPYRSRDDLSPKLFPDSFIFPVGHVCHKRHGCVFIDHVLNSVNWVNITRGWVLNSW